MRGDTSTKAINATIPMVFSRLCVKKGFNFKTPIRGLVVDESDGQLSIINSEYGLRIAVGFREDDLVNSKSTMHEAIAVAGGQSCDG
jgi:hypothetical protein